MIRVDVRHERVARAINPFANDATVFLLTLGMLVRDMSLQRRFRAQYFSTQLTRKQLLGRTAWNKINEKIFLWFSQNLIGFWFFWSS